jgi:oligopeptide transport system substrate-binding protein
VFSHKKLLFSFGEFSPRPSTLPFISLEGGEKMRSKWFAVFSALVLVSMILAACAPAATPTQAPAPTQAPVATKAPEPTAKPNEPTKVPEPTKAPEPTKIPAPVAAKDTLRVNTGSFPDMIDPQKSSFVNEIAHIHLVYEGLTRLDKDLKTIPAAAEKWAYSADATEITFTLRKGLTYSDGSLLNAKRFEYSILRNVDPATAGEYAAITDDIKGAAEWRGADLKKATADELAKLKAAVKVQAVDAAGAPCKDYAQADCLTLKIGLAQAAPYFHVVMGLWVTYPVKEEIIKAGGDKWWLSAKNQIGNGPFVWQTLEEKQKSVFIPNPLYWGGVAKYNVEYRYIVDSAVAFAAYKNNEFDVVGLAAEDRKIVDADPVLSKEKQVYPGACTYAIMFHQLKEPFTDPKVRAAFAYALDRDGWVKDVLNNQGSSTLTWIPKGFPGYDADEKRWGYDPAAAKKAIAESTYGSVAKLPEITLSFSDSPRNRTRFEWLAAKWKEVLGADLKLKLNPVEATAYTALTKDIKTAPQVFLLGWCADYPHQQNWLSVYWMTGAFGERIGYSNKELDALMKKADSTVDEKAAADLYAQAQRMLTDGIPVAFMWNNVQSFMVKPWVKGINVTPQDHVYPGDINPLSISIQK